MTKILIVYASDYGNTEKAAQSLAAGVSEVEGVEAVTMKAQDVTTDDVVDCDSLVIGSPVHMGSPDWRVKKFIDTVCSELWADDKAVGKVGAVFTTGSGHFNSFSFPGVSNKRRFAWLRYRLGFGTMRY